MRVLAASQTGVLDDVIGGIPTVVGFPQKQGIPFTWIPYFAEYMRPARR